MVTRFDFLVILKPFTGGVWFGEVTGQGYKVLLIGGKVMERFGEGGRCF